MKRLREDRDDATGRTTKTNDAKTTKLNPDAKVAKLLTTHGERFMSMFDGDRRPSPEEEEELDAAIPSSSSSSSSSDSEHSSTPLESDDDSTDKDSDFVEVIFDGRKVTPSSGGGKGLPNSNSNAKQRRQTFLLSAHKSPPSSASAKTPVSSSSLQSERKRFMSSKASVIINSNNGGHATDNNNKNNNKHITPTKTNKGGSAGLSSPQPPSSSDHMTKEEFLKMQREVHLYGASALDKKEKKKFDSAMLRQIGAQIEKGPRVPAFISKGMAKKKNEREERALAEGIASGMVKQKGLGKKKKREQRRNSSGGGDGGGLMEDGGKFRNGVLRVSSSMGSGGKNEKDGGKKNYGRSGGSLLNLLEPLGITPIKLKMSTKRGSDTVQGMHPAAKRRLSMSIGSVESRPHSDSSRRPSPPIALPSSAADILQSPLAVASIGFITDRAPPPSPLALHRQAGHTHNNNALDENSPPAHRKPPLPPAVHPSSIDHENPHEHFNNNNPTTITTTAAVGEEINTTKKDEEEMKATFFPTPHNTNPPPMNRTFPSSSPWNPSPPAIKSGGGGGSQTFSLTTVPSFSSWIVEGIPLQPMDPQHQQQQQQQFQEPLGPPQVSDVIANITGTTPVHHHGGNNNGGGGDDDDAPMSPLDKLIVEIDCEEGFPATAIDFDDEYDEQQREQEKAVGMEGLVMEGGDQQLQQSQMRMMTTRSAARRQMQG